MKNGPYELVVAPLDYPGKKYRGKYVYKHRLVWWEKTGEVLPTRIHVHHKNKSRRDNRFSNLSRKSIVEHAKEHAIPAPKVELECAWCTKLFEAFERDVRYKKKKGQVKFYCGRSCQVSAQQKGIRDAKAKAEVKRRRR